VKGDRIPVTATNYPNTYLAGIVDRYKKQLDHEMGQIIGEAPQPMEYKIPESLLTNFTADAMARLDTKYTGGKNADLAIMNLNGHRANLPQGMITVGNIYEIYSFDNSLVVVQLKGTDLIDLLSSYTEYHRLTVSSSVRFVVTKENTITGISINEEPVDPEKIYTIVTLDYLYDGNDGMTAFKKAVSAEPTGVILRSYMIEYIINLTQQGEKITSNLDGRISIEE